MSRYGRTMRALGAGLLAAALCLAGAMHAPAQEYPRRPVSVIVPWGAGGGTDAVARIVATLLEKELGQPFNVINRTGGSGVVGHSAIAYAQPDGYTIGLSTVELTMMHWMGLTQLTYEDMAPIGLVNQDPAALIVAEDAPWKTAGELLDYVEQHPGELKGTGTGQGGIWHLAQAGMLRDAGLAPDAIRWVPSRGAAPGLQDLVAGGVDVAPVSLPEAQSLMEAGRVRALAVMSEQRNDAFPDVPTLAEATGLEWTTAAWRGFTAPAGTPEEVLGVLEAALDEVVHSQRYRDFLANRGFGWDWMPAGQFGEFMAAADERNGEVMEAIGLTQ